MAKEQIRSSVAVCLPGERKKKVAEMEEKAAATLLASILSKRGIETMEKQLTKLINLGRRLGHFGDTQTLFSVLEWREFGDSMWQKQIDRSR